MARWRVRGFASLHPTTRSSGRAETSAPLSVALGGLVDRAVCKTEDHDNQTTELRPPKRGAGRRESRSRSPAACGGASGCDDPFGSRRAG